MTSRDPTIFKSELTELMAERVRTYIRKFIKSDTLKNSIEIRLRIDGDVVGHDLVWPHYWAVYYHDGRKALRPVNGKYLVWFVDPQDDPRNAGGYPVRGSQVRKLSLSPDQFKDLLRSGKMIVTDYAGPTRGKKFLERLQGKAAGLVDGIAVREFRKHVRANLKDLLRLKFTTRIRK